MDRNSIVSSPRMAGGVLRYHTWPTLQQQTVADHTFHVLRIYMALWGSPSSAVTEYIIRHDLGEIGTGDLPFPVKRENHKLKTIMDDLEGRTLESMGYDEAVVLDSDTLRRIKICDLLEMYEFGIIERSMGNRLATPIINDTFVGVLSLLSDDSERARVHTYLESSVGELT